VNLEGSFLKFKAADQIPTALPLREYKSLLARGALTGLGE
jgi:hypothetical protein